MQVDLDLDLLPSLNLNKERVQVKDLAQLILCNDLSCFSQLETNKQKALLVSLLMEVADNLSRREGD